LTGIGFGHSPMMKHIKTTYKYLNFNNTLKNTIMGRYYNGDINGKFWFGIQSSDAPSRFSASAECEQSYIEYYFDESHIEEVKEELQNIAEVLGENIEKIDNFFVKLRADGRIGYSDEDLAKEGITDELLSEYADYKLGKQIEECIEREGQCQFSAEI